MRHGEVKNPMGVLYGRLPGFPLSELGERMAEAAAADLLKRQVPVRAVYASPLERAQQSAAPIAAVFGLEVQTDERLIEPTNRFEGTVMRDALRNPLYWRWLYNPTKPSWGEAFRSISQRMYSAVQDAFRAVPAGDVVLVGHQLPIWITHLALNNQRFSHDPRLRRCALSSITTLVGRRDGRILELDYREPAAELQRAAIDVGAV